jgi:hypothetical protein
MVCDLALGVKIPPGSDGLRYGSIHCTYLFSLARGSIYRLYQPKLSRMDQLAIP